jgi:hypothetical protein
LTNWVTSFYKRGVYSIYCVKSASGGVASHKSRLTIEAASVAVRVIAMKLILALMILLNLAPIEAARPITEDSRVIVGTAQPGEVLRLRIIQQPGVDLETTVDSDGHFEVRVPGLTVGHEILIEGYGEWSVLLVESVGSRVFLPMVE